MLRRQSMRSSTSLLRSSASVCMPAKPPNPTTPAPREALSFDIVGLVDHARTAAAQELVEACPSIRLAALSREECDRATGVIKAAVAKYLYTDSNARVTYPSPTQLNELILNGLTRAAFAPADGRPFQRSNMQNAEAYRENYEQNTRIPPTTGSATMRFVGVHAAPFARRKPRALPYM
ncbi:hypothetical protein EDB85DRAFT_1893172 [Lactarius pseudohatsudake]|nr:hypothetical protein EDB85DRAFT_1893172 [Lactarius pseudohatsudake]